jgi:hypothetical protein
MDASQNVDERQSEHFVGEDRIELMHKSNCVNPFIQVTKVGTNHVICPNWYDVSPRGRLPPPKVLQTLQNTPSAGIVFKAVFHRNKNSAAVLGKT